MKTSWVPFMVDVDLRDGERKLHTRCCPESFAEARINPSPFYSRMNGFFPRSRHSATSINDKVYVFGGAVGHSTRHNLQSDLLELTFTETLFPRKLSWCADTTPASAQSTATTSSQSFYSASSASQCEESENVSFTSTHKSSSSTTSLLSSHSNPYSVSVQCLGPLFLDWHMRQCTNAANNSTTNEQNCGSLHELSSSDEPSHACKENCNRSIMKFIQIQNQTYIVSRWPTVREGSSLVADPTSCRLYLFGGYGASVPVKFSLPERCNADDLAALNHGVLSCFLPVDSCPLYLNDVWMFDIARSTWEELFSATGLEDASCSAPAPRAGQTAIFHDGCMYIHGGVSKAPDEGGDESTLHFGDIWRFNPRSVKWSLVFDDSDNSNIVAPSPRVLHTSAIFKKKFIINFGYNDGRALDDVWSFDFTVSQWSRISPICDSNVQLKPRYWHGACQLGNLLIFGGGKGPRSWHDDAYYLDMETHDDACSLDITTHALCRICNFSRKNIYEINDTPPVILPKSTFLVVHPSKSCRLTKPVIVVIGGYDDKEEGKSLSGGSYSSFLLLRPESEAAGIVEAARMRRRSSDNHVGTDNNKDVGGVAHDITKMLYGAEQLFQNLLLFSCESVARRILSFL